MPNANLPTVDISHGGTNNASLAVTAGGVIYTDGTKLVNVGAGSSGQYLKSNAGSAPSWATVSSGGLTYLGGGSMGTGTSYTLSGLNLTSYKALFITTSFGGTNNTGYLVFGGMQTPNVISANILYSGVIWLDLINNPYTSAILFAQSSVNYRILEGSSNYTQASTSLTFSLGAGNLYTGSVVYVFGLA